MPPTFDNCRPSGRRQLLSVYCCIVHYLLSGELRLGEVHETYKYVPVRSLIYTLVDGLIPQEL